MARWTSDGTHDPGPPPVLADPLSGLVTGGRYEQEALRVRVVEPSMPDIAAVREAMHAMLDDESELLTAVEPEPETAAEPEPAPEAVSGPPTSEIPVQAPPPAEEPKAQTPPQIPPARREQAQPGMLSARIPTQRGGNDSAVSGEKPQGRSSRFSPGMAAIALLLLVIAVIAIVVVANLIGMIASLFS